MDHNILRIKSLKNKMVTVYKNSHIIKIPIRVQICVILYRLKNKEYQIYLDYIKSTQSEKIDIFRYLFNKYKNQKIKHDEIKYGHPYTETWKNMTVNVKQKSKDNLNDKLYLTHQNCTSFWEDVNDKTQAHLTNVNSDIFNYYQNEPNSKLSTKNKTLKAKKK